MPYESIFTEEDTWDELRKNVLEATSAFFFDRPRPERVRLHSTPCPENGSMQ